MRRGGERRIGGSRREDPGMIKKGMHLWSKPFFEKVDRSLMSS